MKKCFKFQPWWFDPIKTRLNLPQYLGKFGATQIVKMLVEWRSSGLWMWHLSNDDETNVFLCWFAKLQKYKTHHAVVKKSGQNSDFTIRNCRISNSKPSFLNFGIFCQKNIENINQQTLFLHPDEWCFYELRFEAFFGLLHPHEGWLNSVLLLNKNIGVGLTNCWWKKHGSLLTSVLSLLKSTWNKNRVALNPFVF